MDELNERYQPYCNFTLEKRIDVIKQCYEKIIAYYKENYNEEIAKEVFLRMFCAFSYVVNPPTFEQYNLYKSVVHTNLTYEDFVVVAKEKKELLRDCYFHEFIYAKDNKVINEVIVLCVCLFTVKGYISNIEKRYIESHFMKH